MRAGVRSQAPESGPDATASTRVRQRVGFRAGDIVFGAYRLERVLDRRGCVWHALAPGGAGVALKLGSVASIAHEHVVLTRCAHPHVVTVIALCNGNVGAALDADTAAAAPDADGRWAGLALEYLPGGDLVSLAGADWRHWLLPVSDLVAALGHIHAQGYVHRDVKARNVRLDRDDRAHLIDFGSAARAGSAWTRAGTTAEAIDPGRGPQPVAPADDAYALAALLHELLYGCPPRLTHAGPSAVRGRSRSVARGALLPVADLVAARLGVPDRAAPTVGDFADALKSLQQRNGIGP